MADNKMFFRPLTMNINSWCKYTTCEGECNECDQEDMCKKVVNLLKELKSLYTDEELKEMDIKNV